MASLGKQLVHLQESKALEYAVSAASSDGGIYVWADARFAGVILRLDAERLGKGNSSVRGSCRN